MFVKFLTNLETVIFTKQFPHCRFINCQLETKKPRRKCKLIKIIFGQ